MTTFTVYPLRGHFIDRGVTYTVDDPFHASIRVVLLAPVAASCWSAYIEGDAATELRRLGCPNVVVRAVGEVSGTGEGEVVE